MIFGMLLASFSGGIFAQSFGGSISRAFALEFGHIFSAVASSAPTSLGNWSSIATAFTGDLSHVLFPISHQITGASTLGQPTSGYQYTYEAYPFAGYLYNTSGWNNSTSGNSGRTAAVYDHVHLVQNGQGDMVAHNVSCIVVSTRSGATNYLANPACVGINGGFFAAAEGAFLNPQEWDFIDNGHDVAVVGINQNLKRTNNTGALGAWWTPFRTNSMGSVPSDVAFSAIGKWNFGLDLSFSDFGVNKAAISLSAAQRLYLDVTATDSTGQGRFPSAVGTAYLDNAHLVQTSGAQFLSGRGSPVGAVSCTTRCLYVRTDGGAGSTLYINETGRGTSGWAAK
jgi:hypothetical protein